MRPRISIRGSVRPSVGPSVTLSWKMKKIDILGLLSVRAMKKSLEGASLTARSCFIDNRRECGRQTEGLADQRMDQSSYRDRRLHLVSPGKPRKYQFPWFLTKAYSTPELKDRGTDGRTDGRTDGQTCWKRCKGASENTLYHFVNDLDIYAC